MLRKIMLLMIALGIFSCYNAVAPDYPYERLKPKEWYPEAYKEVLTCGKDFLSVKGPRKFEDIDFYISYIDTFTVRGIRTRAMATGWDIFLTATVVDSPRIVKHEMMHVATQIFSHPSRPFYSCKLMYGQ